MAPPGVSYMVARWLQTVTLRCDTASAGAATAREEMAAATAAMRGSTSFLYGGSAKRSRGLQRPGPLGGAPVVLCMTHVRVLPRVAAAVGAVLAAAVVAAPAGAASRGLPPSLYALELPAGVVEHGVVDMSTTGNPRAYHVRVEYWADNSRWRSVTRDATTGAVQRQAVGTDTRTTYYEVGSHPRVYVVPFRSVPPLAGWAPGYNRELVQKGLLSPVSPVTIAGLAGTLYTVPNDRKSTEPGDDRWTTDDTSADTQIALEDGTFAPLVRQTSMPNGKYGTFVQREELVSRERLTGQAAASAKLSRAAASRTIKAWRSKVRRR